MKAETVALRDQIMATLSDRGSPISTDEVVALVHVDHCPGSTGCAYIWREHHGCRGHCWKPKVYNSLRALERKGLVTRHRPPDMYAVFWSAATDPSDAEMNAILDALEESL